MSGYRRDLKSSLDVKWTETDCDRVRNLVQKFYRDCAVDSNHAHIESIPTSFEEVIKNCYQMRQNEIDQAVAKDCLLSSGAKNLVENIDWKLKWIMGSSKLSTLREPILQMSLSCVEKSENHISKNVIGFEIDMEQVDNLIDSLEKAKAAFTSNTVTPKNFSP